MIIILLGNLLTLSWNLNVLIWHILRLKIQPTKVPISFDTPTWPTGAVQGIIKKRFEATRKWEGNKANGNGGTATPGWLAGPGPDSMPSHLIPFSAVSCRGWLCWTTCNVLINTQTHMACVCVDKWRRRRYTYSCRYKYKTWDTGTTTGATAVGGSTGPVVNPIRFYQLVCCCWSSSLPSFDAFASCCGAGPPSFINKS